MEQSTENYSAWTYSIAKTLAELPFQIIYPIIFTCITYFMVGFVETVEAFFKMLLVVVIIGNLGYSFGLMAASVFPTAEVSMATVPLVMLPMSIVAGLFSNTDRLEPAWEWLTYISFPRYSYMGLFLGEFGALDTLCAANDTKCSYKTGQDVINYYGFTSVSWGTCVYALIIYMLGLKVIAAFSLWIQGRNKRGNLTFQKNLEARELSPRAAAISPRTTLDEPGAN
ncbi:ABC transporter, putative [Bodo saltans]|uniref:ABC transporter, putative n=1 Tax=Bodo saltans TaxID=75058 RepID=A0A0S4J7F2_BODSA|nr:ABC transporter, putative [Bodo saltans]|eukprot:CUG85971.1 ABC transporter, putative [Bodo saltans]